MKLQAECIPCFLQQALRVLEATGREASNEDRKRLLDAVMAVLLRDDLMAQLPGKVGGLVYGAIGKHLGDPDVYKDAKRRSNEEAAQLLPRLEAIVEASDDPFRTAAMIAIAGNIIDLGADVRCDLDAELASLHLAIDDLAPLRADLGLARSVLYCGDNAGEIYFDKVLLARIKQGFNVSIAYSVRAGPVINDATIEDARAAGIDAIATVVEASATPGVIVADSSSAFKDAWARADVIISKGQGNFETLGEQDDGKIIYYMLKVKCKIIERVLGVPVGSSVLARGDRAASLSSP